MIPHQKQWINKRNAVGKYLRLFGYRKRSLAKWESLVYMMDLETPI